MSRLVDLCDEVLLDFACVKNVSVLDHCQVCLFYCVQVQAILDGGVTEEVEMIIADGRTLHCCHVDAQ